MKKNDGMYIGTDVNTKEEKYINDFSGNILITGGEKNIREKFLLFTAEYLIKKKKSLLFFNESSKPENILPNILESANFVNRLNDIKYISLDFAKQSFKFNPLYKKSNKEISSFIPSLFPLQKDETYVFNKYRELTELILLSIELIDNNFQEEYSIFNNRENITFKDLYLFLNQENLHFFYKQLDSYVEPLEKKEIIRLNLKKYVFLQENRFILDSYKVLLKELSENEFGELFCSNTTYNYLDDFDNKIIILDSYSENEILSSYFKKIMLFHLKHSVANEIIYQNESKELFCLFNNLSDNFNEIESLYNHGGGVGIKSILNIENNIEIKNINILKANSLIKINFLENHNKVNPINSFYFNFEDLSNKDIKCFIREFKEVSFVPDMDNLSDGYINNVFNEFCSLVPNKKFQKIIRKGLMDISLLKFSEDIDFANFPAENKIISLKEHILNIFILGMSKFKKDTNMENALLVLFFIFFARSNKICEKYNMNNNIMDINYIGEKDILITKKYLTDIMFYIFGKRDEIFLPIFELLEKMNIHNNRVMKQKEPSFIRSTIYKAVELELKSFKKNSKYVDRDLFIDFIKENMLEKHKENYIKIIFKKKSIHVYKDNNIEYVIRKKDISLISFYENQVDLLLSNSKRILIKEVSARDIKKFIKLI